MSDVKKLIAGIVLVAIAIGLLLSSGGFMPYLGGLFGLAGAFLIVRALFFGKL